MLEVRQHRSNYHFKADQRQHPRHQLYTSAMILGNIRPNRLCWIKNISLGGALIVCPHRLMVSSRIHILLHLPWYDPEKLEAEVVRQQTHQKKEFIYGVRFLHMSQSTRLRIENAIQISEEAQTLNRESTALVISDEHELRYTLEKELFLLGIRWVMVHTPLDAIVWLQDWKVKVDTVFVDLSIEHFNVLSMLRYLSDEHSEVRRVLIAMDHPATFIRVAASYGRVNAIVTDPTDKTQLERALSQA